MEKNGKIYKIVNSINDKIYVGSTQLQYLSKRMGHHRENCIKAPTCGKLYPVMTELGIDKFNIILLETIKFTNKEELRAKEHEWILKLDTINNGYNTILKDGHLPSDSRDRSRKGIVKYNKENIANVGIHFRDDRGHMRWICTWRNESKNKLKSKSFAVPKYGDEEAKKLAIDYRNEIIKNIEIYN